MSSASSNRMPKPGLPEHHPDQQVDQQTGQPEPGGQPDGGHGDQQHAGADQQGEVEVAAHGARPRVRAHGRSAPVPPLARRRVSPAVAGARRLVPAVDGVDHEHLVAAGRADTERHLGRSDAQRLGQRPPDRLGRLAVHRRRADRDDQGRAVRPVVAAADPRPACSRADPHGDGDRAGAAAPGRPAGRAWSAAVGGGRAAWPCPIVPIIEIGARRGHPRRRVTLRRSLQEHHPRKSSPDLAGSRRCHPAARLGGSPRGHKRNTGGPTTASTRGGTAAEGRRDGPARECGQAAAQRCGNQVSQLTGDGRRPAGRTGCQRVTRACARRGQRTSCAVARWPGVGERGAGQRCVAWATRRSTGRHWPHGLKPSSTASLTGSGSVWRPARCGQSPRW